ncbi:MAG: cation diffusion facilitator family transporter [Cyanobacteriota bacterium]|nr:cation diffusion facilitator family transporter [Cyanobacteriota bacterium]
MGAPHPSHHHGSHGAGTGVARAFRWSILLNGALTALQLVVGLGFGSLALIGDALHNLGDVVGLALGWGAERLSRQPAKGRFTYGYGRSTHLASLLNALLIFSAGVVVVVEAIQRLFAPVPLVSTPVAWAAAAGIVVNLLSARLFGHDHHHDLNQRAAVVHLLTDAAVSVAVLLSALLVGLTGWLWLDPLTAIGVGVAVMASAWGLLREALALNLDAVPPGIDLEQVRAVLLALPGVRVVEHLHVWGLSTRRSALTAHLVVGPVSAEGVGGEGRTEDAGGAVLALAQQRLAAIGIRHTTLQLVTHPPSPPAATASAHNPSEHSRPEHNPSEHNPSAHGCSEH